MTTRHRLAALGIAFALTGGTLAGCGGQSTESTTASVTGAAGQQLNLTANQDRVIPVKDEAAAALLPQPVRDRGTLRVGHGSGAGNAPFYFPATDDERVFIGDESDIAHLIAGALGLKLEESNTSWEGLFLGIDSGQFDLGVSNITVTEARKEKYDFATYRKDDLAVEVQESSSLTFTGPDSLSGKTVAVGSGTNQERILQRYDADLRAAGKPAITIKNYQDNTGTYAALASGQIDAYFGPNPIAAFHVAQTKGTPQATKIVGRVSGAGSSLQGLIGATTKKDSGIIRAVQAALQSTIRSGDYTKVLHRWGLDAEAVPSSEINPPGLPKNDK
ncbi:Extracellular solute-binding protein family 3 OS=Tsukamurella paurometabola (strain ATCC 8368 / DSM / CCUG 35730 / CIP 100753 / JCM 10117 / KCTC 9821 /NBRC 16120 / NCIMB 702349 / NCTC 13040) OX=521096 GN=Tpau_2050 PE=4 SV=1 [Tsukamurella paurometabola]|uniref:Extracellular solute-binding protein family 3 n=1 Tax=Tsukamurella paurometabola (strain ATCC 8368 / DSM 20162 / CCUG 35730 / CIP 100753 / JCM 10117 / KCTC 9821 / NBRC 16120 / NCIMB 702349 / NCTC 13040) TaxID=521096 RepID=D5UNU4_TSUPD|nr:ABC transporter substrate-binding protein [Tsukamurella paurometabola]ADG78662.1 extracellular solute-binding protein family 3 [Tsukamurella paurometabola DSM 20162]SUP32623.1 Sulfate starvation-induced protein 7 [Tsukamurella paurometabola]